MKNILVPIGTGNHSLDTLQYAIDFAADNNANILVYQAFNLLSKAGIILKIDEILEREAKNYLKACLAEVDTKGVQTTICTGRGDVVETIKALHEEHSIDLIVVGQKSNSIKEDLFLGKTSGKIVKQTPIPALIIPPNYFYKPMNRILMAFKSGVVKEDSSLAPLKNIKEKYQATLNLLLVKTPKYKVEDLVIAPALDTMKDTLKSTENITTFQGVLEHFQSNNPDLLCVFRRKRGFFKKLWEKNIILKSEFHCGIPLLVLNGE